MAGNDLNEDHLNMLFLDYLYTDIHTTVTVLGNSRLFSQCKMYRNSFSLANGRVFIITVYLNVGDNSLPDLTEVN